MTQVVCLFVLMGWSLLRSDDQGLLMTVGRWFFFGFLVPVLIIVVLADSGIIFSERDDFIDDMCLNYELHYATYEQCAEEKGRYYDEHYADE